LPFGAAIININQIIQMHMARRLAVLFIDFYSTAINRLGRQRAGFKKPRRPQPFIDPHLLAHTKSSPKR
jgi:hypothetical protein